MYLLLRLFKFFIPLNYLPCRSQFSSFRFHFIFSYLVPVSVRFSFVLLLYLFLFRFILLYSFPISIDIPLSPIPSLFLFLFPFIPIPTCISVPCRMNVELWRLCRFTGCCSASDTCRGWRQGGRGGGAVFFSGIT